MRQIPFAARRPCLTVQLFAALTGIIIFVESNISALTVGTIFRPIFDKLKFRYRKYLVILIYPNLIPQFDVSF